VHLSAIARGEALEVELPYISIPFNAVEEMVATLEDPHPLLRPADIAVRTTLTMPTSSSGGFVRKTWTIRGADDVAKAAYEIATQAIEKICQHSKCYPVLSRRSPFFRLTTTALDPIQHLTRFERRRLSPSRFFCMGKKGLNRLRMQRWEGFGVKVCRSSPVGWISL